MQWVAGVGAASERSVAYVGELAEILGNSLRLLFLSPLKRGRMLQRAMHEAMGAGVRALPIVSLITFFIVGLTLLMLVNEEKAREARNSTAF